MRDRRPEDIVLSMKAILPLVAVLALFSPLHAQEWAKKRLEESPRHGEWVTVKSGGRDVKCYLVYPEARDRAPAVAVIHEIFGLTEWVRGVADQLAAAGCVAIAPDFLSGQTYAGVDEARKAIGQLSSAQVAADLDAAVDHVRALPASNGVVAVAGFCWGGAKAFEYAAHRKDLGASYVFYGTGPQTEEAVRPIGCPVYGFYAENDARVNEGLPRTEELMKTAGKTFEPKTYAGAGHGFMRAGEAPDASPANAAARQEAWQRWSELLKRLSAKGQ